MFMLVVLKLMLRLIGYPLTPLPNNYAAPKGNEAFAIDNPAARLAEVF